MSRLTGTLGHALLGVLAEGPRTGYAPRQAPRAVDRLHLAGEPQPGLSGAGEAARGGADPRERGRAARRPRLRADRSGPRGGAPLAARDGAVADGFATRRRCGSFFLWLLEPEEAEAYLRGEAERARGRRWRSSSRSRRRRIRQPEDAGPTGSRSSSASADAGPARVGRVGGHSSPPPVSVTTIASSTRMPKRPSIRIDGSSVKVIPASSGVSSSTERNGARARRGRSAFPSRWRKPSPEAGRLDRAAAGSVHLAGERAPDRGSRGRRPAPRA